MINNDIEPLKRYYSQHGEDYLLWKFFDFKKDGFFVEVGAFDGVHLSNTYSFEREGWKGICIEPGQYFKNCKKNRPNSICINAACVSNDDIKEITFYEEELGLLSSLEMSTEKKYDIKKRYGNRKLAFPGHKEKKVKAQTLNNIFEENNVSEIDFITIDVEGAEIEVLKGINLEKYQPKVVMLEANDEEHKKELMDYMIVQNGYTFVREVNVNLIFVSSKEDFNKMYNIEINCTIEKQVHPLGLKHTIADYLYGLKYFNNHNITTVLKKKNQELEQKQSIINQKNQELEQTRNTINQKNQELEQTRNTINQKNQELSQKQNTINQSQHALTLLMSNLQKIVQTSTQKHPLQKIKAYKNLINIYHNLEQNIISPTEQNNEGEIITKLKKIIEEKEKILNEKLIVLPSDDFFRARHKKHYLARDESPILIYQVGKVGSSTIYKSLKNKMGHLPVYQIHNIITADKILKQENEKGFRDGIHHLTIGSELNHIIEKHPNIRWKIIVGIREPIGRWLSDIFQNINERYNNFVLDNGELKYEELLTFVKETLETEPMQDWFINELEKRFDVDLSQIHFNKEQGYTVYRKDGLEILFYQLESLKPQFDNMFKEFLPQYAISLQNANESSSKEYYEQYKKIQSMLKFDKTYLEKFYHEISIARFFYSESQINDFIHKWQR